MTTARDALNNVLHAAAIIENVAGVPQFAWQSGEFDNAIVDNGVGDYTISLRADKGIAGNEYAVMASFPEATLQNTITVDDDPAGPNLDATRDKRILIAAGIAVPAAADLSCYIAFVRRRLI